MDVRLLDIKLDENFEKYIAWKLEHVLHIEPTDHNVATYILCGEIKGSN